MSARPHTECIALVLLLFCSACTLPPSAGEQRAQVSAVQRWDDCIERYRSEVNTPPSASQACAGHRRDVLEFYPRHLAERLERILVERTRERLDKPGMRATSVETIRLRWQ